MTNSTDVRVGGDADVIVPRSIRYRLSRSEVAAVLAAIGVEADGLLLGLHDRSDDPIPVLRASDLVDDQDQVHPFLRDAMVVAARPGRTIHAVTSVPGADEWVDLLIGASQRGGPYVTIDATDDGVDLYAVETAMEIAAVLDDLFRLTSYPTHPVDPDVVLDVPAWVGLLAVSDVRRLRRLRNDLRRRPDAAEPMSVIDVDGAITVGLDSTDSRWAVSAAVPIAPVSLRQRRVRPAQAVEKLLELGLVKGDESAFDVTPLGEHLVELIEQAIVFGSITLTYRRPDREVRGGEMIVYRTPTRLAVGVWTGTSTSPRLIITEPMAEGAVSMVRRLVDLSVQQSPTAQAPSAGVVDEPPPAPPFEPTHHVGVGGIDLRDAPDDARDPVGRLPAGTPVRVLARQGDWAEIVIESGARSWVEASGLGAPSTASWMPTHRAGEGGTPAWERPDAERSGRRHPGRG